MNEIFLSYHGEDLKVDAGPRPLRVYHTTGKYHLEDIADLGEYVFCVVASRSDERGIEEHLCRTSVPAGKGAWGIHFDKSLLRDSRNMEYAAVQIVHRDIKPENIFGIPKSQRVVIDFGATRNAMCPELKLVTPCASRQQTHYEECEQSWLSGVMLIDRRDDIERSVLLDSCGYTSTPKKESDLLEVAHNLQEQSVVLIGGAGYLGNLFAQLMMREGAVVIDAGSIAAAQSNNMTRTEFGEQFPEAQRGVSGARKLWSPKNHAVETDDVQRDTPFQARESLYVPPRFQAPQKKARDYSDEQTSEMFNRAYGAEADSRQPQFRTTSCPSIFRFEAIATKPWTNEELKHIASCPHCLQVRSLFGMDSTTEIDKSCVSNPEVLGSSVG